jgi:hypothetical protein
MSGCRCTRSRSRSRFGRNARAPHEGARPVRSGRTRWRAAFRCLWSRRVQRGTDVAQGSANETRQDSQARRTETHAQAQKSGQLNCTVLFVRFLISRPTNRASAGRPSSQSARRPRMTSSPRSRIFLRSVFRLRPSRCAARIWLPRVAARQMDRSGRSISCRTRS